MALPIIKNEIAEFLSSDDLEVLCIRGDWGVGKTYVWNDCYREARSANSFGLKYYSYVSLFGIDSLDKLKFHIFRNVMQTTVGGSSVTVESAFKNIFGSAAKDALNKFTGVDVSEIYYASVSETIVCIDDLERKGDGLPIKDVLGLVNDLKERKSCKVAIILNDDALKADAIDYASFNERVVDKSIAFILTSEELAKVVISPDTPEAEYVLSLIDTLGITNIRITKKIERFIKTAAEVFKNFHPLILKQAIHSIVLFSWSVYEPITAPSWEFLSKAPQAYYDVASKKEFSDQEHYWMTALENYEFHAIDQFDEELYRGVKNGYLDNQILEMLASKMENQIQLGENEEAIRAAWRAYHESFNDNEEEIVDGLISACRSNIRSVSPLNLNGTVKLLRDLGRDNAADELIEFYVQERAEERELFDPTKRFPGDITDQMVSTAFDAQYSKYKDERNLGDVLFMIHSNKSWTLEDINFLVSVSEQEYYEFFRGISGATFSGTVDGALFVRAKLGKNYPELSSNILNALLRIGAESRINKRRLKHKFGIDIDENNGDNSE